MKDLVTIKDGKWVWPIYDENSWVGQNEFKDLYKTLLPYVKSNNVMVQAGGNCGYILNTFVDHFETIYTFEPDPVNFYCLTQNITSPNVFKMQACLSDKKETVAVQQLIRTDRPNDIGGVHVAGKGSVLSIVIDDLNLDDCNLLQLDIEGYELKALKGAKNTITRYKPVICVELCEKWLNRYNNTSNEVQDFLEELGYKLIAQHGVDSIFVYNN